MKAVHIRACGGLAAVLLHHVLLPTPCALMEWAGWEGWWRRRGWWGEGVTANNDGGD